MEIAGKSKINIISRFRFKILCFSFVLLPWLREKRLFELEVMVQQLLVSRKDSEFTAVLELKVELRGPVWKLLGSRNQQETVWSFSASRSSSERDLLMVLESPKDRA